MKTTNGYKLQQVAQMPIQKVFAVLCVFVFFSFSSYAQIEIEVEDSIAADLLGEEIESDSIPWLDSIIQGNTQIDFDDQFNYNFIAGLANDSFHFRAGLLYDLETNTVVWQKDMNYAYPMASVTKIMTALLAIEAIDEGLIDWHDEIVITTQRKIYTGRGRKRRKKIITVTDRYTLRDLLKMTMIESNNYAAVLVGKHVAKGDLNAFVMMMNQRAKELEMSNTFYSNPSGLPAAYAELDNSSSPHDLLLLSQEALKHPELIEIASMGYAVVNNGHSNYTIRNHNGLVRDYVNEVDGLKTGFTRNAGFCLVAVARRYEHRLIAIVLGYQSVWKRNLFVAGLFNNYYKYLGLGEMGSQLSDSALALVKPGYCNEDFNYSAVARKVPQSVKSEQIDIASTDIKYQTVIEDVRKTHVVKSGETLSKIANKYDVSQAELKKWNRLKSTSVRKGQKLTVVVQMKKVVPVIITNEIAAAESDVSKTIEVAAVDSAGNDASTVQKIKLYNNGNKNYIVHTVQVGDTLWNIAQRYNLNSIDSIKKLNHITKNHIKIGQKVKCQYLSLNNLSSH
jgi:D-alanyl-D-alanine carboxypeptidase